MALADFQRIDHFGDPTAEARACRSACALFDLSFLAFARICGGRARQIVEAFTGRSLTGLPVGKITYALRVGDAGEVIADLTIWRIDAETFEVMSGRHEDIANLAGYAGPGVAVTELTNRATFAVQGPASLDALRRLGVIDAVAALPYFGFTDASLDGIACRVGRLGYTGEPGFEVICDRSDAERLWQAIERYVRPAGFIALDMLRIEAGFVLFSNEFRLPVTPAEAGLGKFYEAAHQPLPKITLVSFVADADRLAGPWQPRGPCERPSMPGEIAVTSACESIVAGGILGLGYVFAVHEAEDGAGAGPGASLRDPTGIFRNIRQTPLPYYDTAKRRPRLPWRHASDVDVGPT
jgi:glycine cleavage system aminomethyltransferase T